MSTPPPNTPPSAPSVITLIEIFLAYIMAEMAGVESAVLANPACPKLRTRLGKFHRAVRTITALLTLLRAPPPAHQPGVPAATSATARRAKSRRATPIAQQSPRKTSAPAPRKAPRPRPRDRPSPQIAGRHVPGNA